MQKENSDKEQQYQQELIDIQRNSALNQVLTESKAKNVKAVAALLDNDAITLKDGQLIGAKEQLESLMKTDAYLFDLGTKPGSYNPAGGESVTTLSFEEAMEKGDLDSYLKQKIESEEQE
ncbi:phage scaffolding protein [Jeotgalibaca porci]|uniref:phage scaffolding protein n=1 Tax=Jeotgalibaca porci TaxID=1868793 RepID=UPI0035A1372D